MATTITPRKCPKSARTSGAFLDIEDLAARYGIGRSKAYELVNQPGFPRSVVPGMTRIPIEALRAYELSYSLGSPTPCESLAAPLAPPPARRAGRPAKAVA